MRWWQHGISDRTKTDNAGILICDLACGSGEVTVALQEWWEICRSRVKLGTNLGVKPNVNLGANSTAIQLRPAVSRPPVGRPNPNSSGSRPIAPSLLAPFPSINSDDPAPRIVAADPYTADAYLTRTGLPCATLSFQDIAQDGLPQPSQPHVPLKVVEAAAPPKEDSPLETSSPTEHESVPNLPEKYMTSSSAHSRCISSPRQARSSRFFRRSHTKPGGLLCWSRIRSPRSRMGGDGCCGTYQRGRKPTADRGKRRTL